MRLNISYSFTSLILGAIVISSCSRATNNEKTKELNIAERQTVEQKNMDIELDQSLQMSEGEVKIFSIKLATPAVVDATVLWTLYNNEIKPSDRFKQTEGATTVKAGETSLSIEIPAHEVDPAKQGDQMFTVLLKSQEAGLNAVLDLKLIDVVIKNERALPTATELKLNLELSKEKREAILRLNEETDTDIIVAVETQDITAIAPKDYTPIKKTIIIPAGQQLMSIPYQILAKPCEKEKAFKIIITNISGAEALAKEVQITIPADPKVSCDTTPTKRKPKATWD